MGEVIMWFQKAMEKEYWKDGKLAGNYADSSTRFPQHYGWTDLMQSLRRSLSSSLKAIVAIKRWTVYLPENVLLLVAVNSMYMNEAQTSV